MKNSLFKGKALYQPKGRAAEYSEWAVNFYTGCSNDCSYCYCKRGVMSKVWDTKPHLKKCFRNKEHAIRTFTQELVQNIDKVRETGILFSFTTDPMLPETKQLTLLCAEVALKLDVPVKILTKRTDWFYSDFFGYLDEHPILKEKKEMVAFGFTLTGCDEYEPHADLNGDRVAAMIRLWYMGFKTWASIEPILGIKEAGEVIAATLGFCHLYKVGLRSGVKEDYYDPFELHQFFHFYLAPLSHDNKIYLKDSVLEHYGYDRESLNDEVEGCFVDADYNIFKD